jgi:hypothetical protein
LIILRRRLHGRVGLTNHDRWFFIQLYRWFPSILQVLTIIRPETLVRWHRAGFRGYWRWISRPQGGRPPIDTELRVLIRRMSVENPLWGAPRIHGELLKLGFEVAQSSVAKYMVKRRGPPSQGWRTFLHNHAPDIAAMDLLVVPTIGFELLYAFVIIRLRRRELIWINVTANPTAEWVARQITEAFLRDGRRPPTACHGHPRQTYCTGLTLAERVCRTADRIDPARVCGPHHCSGRGAPASNSTFLCRLLQLRQNASVIGQGRAGCSPGSAGRKHKGAPHPRRTPSPLPQGLGFRYTEGSRLPNRG